MSSINRFLVSYFTDWWLWEIASVGASMTAMVAIIVILTEFDGRPLQQWTFGLTLNGVVAIFSTISKSAFMLAITECICQLKWLWYERE